VADDGTPNSGNTSAGEAGRSFGNASGGRRGAPASEGFIQFVDETDETLIQWVPVANNNYVQVDDDASLKSGGTMVIVQFVNGGVRLPPGFISAQVSQLP